MPVASAHLLFNTSGLFRILVEAKSRDAIAQAEKDAEQILMRRHSGERDVTVITQDAVLATFDRILTALTLAAGGIAAISLSVAGILIMNVMLIAVSQRTSGRSDCSRRWAHPRAQIRNLFFAEAILLSGIGSVVGLILGEAAVLVIGQIYPIAAGGRALVGGARSTRHGARHRHPVQRVARPPGRAARPGDGFVRILKALIINSISLLRR